MKTLFLRFLIVLEKIQSFSLHQNLGLNLNIKLKNTIHSFRYMLLMFSGLIFCSPLSYAGMSKLLNNDTQALNTHSFVEAQGAFAKKPKNIIFLIGDGMGVNYLSAYRYYKNSDPAILSSMSMQTGSPASVYPSRVTKTLFDQYWVGTSATYPHDDTWVTDSASSATALSSGVKTYNGAIGVDHHQNHLPLLFEQAKKQGMFTGLAVTSPITHATPASFFSHQKSREEQSQIADQFLGSVLAGKPMVDVAFGGGREFFIREESNLIDRLQLAGYEYANSIDALDSLTQAPAIGLFGDYGLVSAIDDNPAKLGLMTKTAIRLLNKKSIEAKATNTQDGRNGFVLLVEGSQIDWCGHANDIACAMAEMHSFELAFARAISFAKHDGNTLVIATADHETGGLSLGSKGEYGWRAEEIYKVRASVPFISAEILKTSLSKKVVKQTWDKFCGFTVSDSELGELRKGASLEKTSSDTFEIGYGPLATIVKRIINEHTLTGWTSSGHTAGDVPVLAYGPGSHLFHGFLDNSEIGKRLHQLLEP